MHDFLVTLWSLRGPLIAACVIALGAGFTCGPLRQFLTSREETA